MAFNKFSEKPLLMKWEFVVLDKYFNNGPEF